MFGRGVWSSAIQSRPFRYVFAAATVANCR
jgi:hypothetical protein